MANAGVARRATAFSHRQVRLKGLLLIGVTEEQAHHAVWARASPTKVIGQEVATPDRVQLTSAALGSDAAQQAIIAVQDSEEQMAYAAVGVASTKGWERAAAFDCGASTRRTMPWANSSGFKPRPSVTQQRPSGTSLSFGQAAAGRKSTHRTRRIAGSRMTSFARPLACQRIPLPNECTFEKRWFPPAVVHGLAGCLLVESRCRVGLKS